jgi:hypothetical protein
MFPDPAHSDTSGQFAGESSFLGNDRHGDLLEEQPLVETVADLVPQPEVFGPAGGVEGDIDPPLDVGFSSSEGSAFPSDESQTHPDTLDPEPTEPIAKEEVVAVPVIRKRGRPRKNPLAVPTPPVQRVTRYAAPSDGVKKTTVSFYGADQERVDYILDTLLETRRHRGGFSDAIKIALRLCPTDPVAIAKIWDEVRAGDKRTQRPKRK